MNNVILSGVEGETQGHTRCCTGVPSTLSAPELITLAAEVPSGFAKYIEQLAREMWERKATEAGYDPELVKAYGDKLSEAVTKGYGKDIFEMEWNEPDHEKLKNLHIDAWKFATGKSHEHMDTLTKALRKPDGSMRTFEEFRVQTVIATGKQLRGLRAEYNTAVASAQMASKWETIQRQKELYPYLEYVAVMDNHVTDKCARLDGVIRHVDDDFWKQYYPPNHYNCRSTVKQLRKIPEGYKDPFEQPNLPEEFKTDFIMQGHLFPADHKYYGMAPNELFNKVRGHLPYDLQFDELELADELMGSVRQHYMVDISAGDYQRNRAIAIDRARTAEVLVDLMPTLDPDTYPAQRQIVFPDAKKGKSPDLRIDKVLWEEERSTNSRNMNNVKNAIRAGSKQADHVIVTLSELLDGQTLFRIVNGRWKDHQDLKEIVFRFNGREWVYKRQ